MEVLKNVKKFFDEFNVIEKKKSIIVIFLSSIISVCINICLPKITQCIVDNGLLIKNMHLVIKWTILFAIVFLGQILINYIREIYRIDIYLSVKKNLTRNILFRLWNAKYKYFINKKKAELITNINYDAESIASIFDNEMLFGITQIFNIIGGIVGLVTINYRMLIGIFLLFPFKVMLVKKFAIENHKYSNEYIKQMESTFRFEEDSLDGIKEIKIYGLQKEFQKKYADIQEDMYVKEKKLHILPQLNIAIDNFLAQICVAYIYIAGIFFVLQNQMTIGSIIAFVTYSSYILGPISTILNIGYKLSGVRPSMDRYRTMYYLDIEESGVKQYISKKNNINNNILMDKITFYYDSQNAIIKNFCAEIKEKTITAISGDNGKGKTTLINLLLRLLDVKSGSIKIGGVDVNNFLLNEYRSKVSFVGQEPFLFCDSLKNNLTLYADIEENRIRDVCQKCGLETLIKEVSLEYNVGDRGMKLSGGQRQKIALARALLSEREIIILDEISSNLDEKSKYVLCNILLQIKKEKTVIIVSHDKEILNIADARIKL